MPQVMAIEQKSHTYSQTETEMLAILRKRGVIGTVCEIGSRIAGFMIYRPVGKSFELINLAVAPEMRRRRFGSEMMVRLKSNMPKYRVSAIDVNVTEENVEAQLFFQRNGFVATRIIANCWEGYPNLAYAMQYRLPDEPSTASDCGNRVSEYFE